MKIKDSGLSVLCRKKVATTSPVDARSTSNASLLCEKREMSTIRRNIIRRIYPAVGGAIAVCRNGRSDLTRSTNNVLYSKYVVEVFSQHGTSTSST
jgi:hypothetical protein